MSKESKDSQSDKIEEAKTIAAETCTGDVASFLLDRLKTYGKPWAAMTEDEQMEKISECKDAADHLVKTVVECIAAEGRKALVGVLKKVQIKDGIQCQVDFSKTDEQRHELFDSQGLSVLLVVADAKAFTGEREKLLPDPDQEDMLDKARNLKNDDKVTTLPKKE